MKILGHSTMAFSLIFCENSIFANTCLMDYFGYFHTKQTWTLEQFGVLQNVVDSFKISD